MSARTCPTKRSDAIRDHGSSATGPTQRAQGNGKGGILLEDRCGALLFTLSRRLPLALTLPGRSKGEKKFGQSL
jgi:hypothetical protein